MRSTIPAIVMVSLFAAACGASTPQAPPLVEVAPALSPDAPVPSTAAAAPAAPAEPNVYKLDLEAWCKAPSAPGAAKASKEDRPRLMAEWISAQIKTDRATALAQRMGVSEPASRKAIFRKELDGQGIKTCPFLDEIP
jgi:hypothetical protein